jgi:hydroxymethylpyrimidine pyrophosphatase-like HAD family hydrolase
MVYSNGAQIVDMPAPGRELSAKPLLLEISQLETEIAGFCTGLARRFDAYFQVFFSQADDITREFIITGKNSSESTIYATRTAMDIRFGDVRDALPDVERGALHCIKGLYIAAPELLDTMRPIIAARFGGRVSLVRSWPTFLEILPSGTSKGTGLLAALRHRNIRPEQVIAFGDEENDLEMFAVSGFSAAPATANKLARDAVDVIVPSNDEDGVAAFLEELFKV